MFTQSIVLVRYSIWFDVCNILHVYINTMFYHGSYHIVQIHIPNYNQLHHGVSELILWWFLFWEILRLHWKYSFPFAWNGSGRKEVLYPVHLAAKLGDALALQAIIEAGADTTKRCEPSKRPGLGQSTALARQISAKDIWSCIVVTTGWRYYLY